MKNFNTIIILLGILSGSILLVENIVLSRQAFVFISQNSSTAMLSFVSILTGIVIGFGIKGKMHERKEESDDSSFNF